MHGEFNSFSSELEKLPRRKSKVDGVVSLQEAKDIVLVAEGDVTEKERKAVSECWGNGEQGMVFTISSSSEHMKETSR